MPASTHTIGSEAITISDTFAQEKLRACSMQLAFIQTMSVASGRVFTKCGRAAPRYWMIKYKPLARLDTTRLRRRDCTRTGTIAGGAEKPHEVLSSETIR